VVCEQGLNIDWILYHNVFQNELRRLGVRGFLEYPFAPWVKKHAEYTFTTTLAEIEACTQCGECEAVCPHHLPVMELLSRMKADQLALVEALAEADWTTLYQDADSPVPAETLASWIRGGRPRRRSSVARSR
jgi:ferredoxin